MASCLDFCYYSLGQVSYEKALKIQYYIHDLCQRDLADPTFLVLEHLPVITLGRNAKETDILCADSFLKKNKIELYKSDRGGRVTCHMPGQLVVYPILSLRHIKLGIKAYVRRLEESLLDLLAWYGVKGKLDKKNPGVWVSGKKIASLGVRVKDRTTLHGLALNVNNDLSLFDSIVPCGLESCSMTKLISHTSIKIKISALAYELIRLLANKLGGSLCDRKQFGSLLNIDHSS